MREERKTALRPRIQHKYAKIKLWFSPLALPTGENPGQFAPWRFVSLAHFIQGHLIDRILAHFRWILVVTLGSIRVIVLLSVAWLEEIF